jgi:hypothetical protein
MRITAIERMGPDRSSLFQRPDRDACETREHSSNRNSVAGAVSGRFRSIGRHPVPSLFFDACFERELMPGSHVFTVASGFGLRVIPAATPYELATGPSPEDLEIDRWAGDRHLFARVTPMTGSYSSRLGDGTGSLDDIAEIEAGPAFTEWWLETSVYRVPLVHGWRAIVEDAPDQPSMFDLIGPADALIYVQTPRRIPVPSAMVAPGQRLHRQGTGARSAWAELRYDHEEREWAQRHDIVELEGVTCVVTAQCPVAAIAALEDARDAIVLGIARS